MNYSIKPLSEALFKPFGDVIEVGDSVEHFAINYGLTTRFHNLAKIDTQQHNGETCLSIFRSKPMPMPIRLSIMERHPWSSQAFYPLSTRPYLVVVAPAGEFDASAIEIFLAQAHQGVNYFPGTWHHFSLALGETSDFLVVDRMGPGDNCEEITLPEPILITEEDLAL